MIQNLPKQGQRNIARHRFDRDVLAVKNPRGPFRAVFPDIVTVISRGAVFRDIVAGSGSKKRPR